MISQKTQSCNHSIRPRRSGGFTLLEVLVALAVMAIALSALVKVSSESTSNMIYLRDKTYAHWVAMNKAVELQASRTWVSIGNSNGVAEMANHEWKWNLSITNTLNKNIRKFKIEVRANVEGFLLDEGSPLVTLTGYIGKA